LFSPFINNPGARRNISISGQNNPSQYSRY